MRNIGSRSKGLINKILFIQNIDYGQKVMCATMARSWLAESNRQKHGGLTKYLTFMSLKICPLYESGQCWQQRS